MNVLFRTKAITVLPKFRFKPGAYTKNGTIEIENSGYYNSNGIFKRNNSRDLKDILNGANGFLIREALVDWYLNGSTTMDWLQAQMSGPINNQFIFFGKGDKKSVFLKILMKNGG